MAGGSADPHRGSMGRTVSLVWLPWRAATELALYGDNGFYRRSERPAAHFRTSVHASARFATGLLALVTEVDAALGHPAALDVVDVGAGDGELLIQLRQLAPADLRFRLRAIAVEVRRRPSDLPAIIGWRPDLPADITGVVLANEWLDNIPLDVVEWTADGYRLILVDPATGAERIGGPPEPADLAWLARWWPAADIGDRAEIGRPRDEAWADTVRRVRQGAALAIDYCHRQADRPAGGTLAAYRDGRAVSPIPDGSSDICAHVALDACAAAATADTTVLTTQREALRALGLTGSRPPLATAGSDPLGYVRALRQAGADGELLDPAGLGGFGWLLHSVGVCALPVQRATMSR